MAAVGALLIEARSFRPFKSSEEYLYAMKEDLAEWLGTLYAEMRINADNFMDRLDTGVSLCRHANAVREHACRLLGGDPTALGNSEVIVNGVGDGTAASDLARALVARAPVSLLAAARPGTFFARDNVSNFIHWCRGPLGVLECLLFETDDLILRKNEKHVVLCLLEVARRGAVLGMPAPLLVLMERQIDRELAGESDCGELGLSPSTGAESDAEQAPGQQLVTNDLRSLDERVRDALGACVCPTQFPMMRVSDGKYRIGDTKILIFVRILRSHVMVRVGGGWDTLGHYLDKHDPCRCRAAHRATLGARVVRGAPSPHSPHSPQDLQGAAVHYVRAPAANVANDAPAAGLAPPHARNNRRSASPAVVRRASSPKQSSRESSRNGSPAGTPLPARRNEPAAAAGARAGSPAASRENSPPESDNGSEISDEGYRSLGVAHMSPAAAPVSRPSAADAEENECLDRFDRETSIDDDPEEVSISTGLRKTDYSLTLYYGDQRNIAKVDAQPQSLPVVRGDSPKRDKPETNSSPSKSHPKSNNTWSGSKGSKARARIDDSTFSPPSGRSSGIRASTRTRPTPPLLQQLLQSAEDAPDDAAVLEKMKELIQQYSPPATPTTALARERRDNRKPGTVSKIPAPVRR